MTDEVPNAAFIVTRDGHVVYGDKIVRMAQAAGRNTHPAYVLEVDWETATDDERLRLEQLAASLAAQDIIADVPWAEGKHAKPDA